METKRLNVDIFVSCDETTGISECNVCGTTMCNIFSLLLRTNGRITVYIEEILQKIRPRDMGTGSYDLLIHMRQNLATYRQQR